MSSLPLFKCVNYHNLIFGDIYFKILICFCELGHDGKIKENCRGKMWCPTFYKTISLFLSTRRLDMTVFYSYGLSLQILKICLNAQNWRKLLHHKIPIYGFPQSRFIKLMYTGNICHNLFCISTFVIHKKVLYCGAINKKK